MREVFFVPEKRSVWSAGDLFVPGLAASLALYYIYTVKDLPGLAQMYGGTLSVVCLLFFAAASYLTFSGRKRSGGSSETLFAFAARYAQVLCLAFLTAFFIFILPYAGYFLSVAFLGTVVAGYLRYSRHPLALLAVGVLISLSGFLLFVLFLNVDLPLDPVSLAVKEAIQSWWR
jgi:hypothetical protein